MGKSGGNDGYNASQFMYGFIFLMYAITAAVLFYVMANRSEKFPKFINEFVFKSKTKVIIQNFYFVLIPLVT